MKILNHYILPTKRKEEEDFYDIPLEDFALKRINLQKLPLEFIELIFSSFDDYHDLLATKMICRKWNPVCNELLRRKIPFLFEIINIKNLKKHVFIPQDYVYSPESPEKVIKPLSVAGIIGKMIHVVFENGDFCSINIARKTLEKKFTISERFLKAQEDSVIMIEDLHIQVINSSSGKVQMGYRVNKDFEISPKKIAVWSDKILFLSHGNLFQGSLKTNTPCQTFSLYSEKIKKCSMKVFENFLIIKKEIYSNTYSKTIDIWDLNDNKWHLKDTSCLWYTPFLHQKAPCLVLSSVLPKSYKTKICIMQIPAKRIRYLNFNNHPLKWGDDSYWTKWRYHSSAQSLYGVFSQWITTVTNVNSVGAMFGEVTNSKHYETKSNSDFMCYNLKNKEYKTYKFINTTLFFTTKANIKFPNSRRIEKFGSFVIFNNKHTTKIWKTDEKKRTICEYFNLSKYFKSKFVLFNGIFYSILKNGEIRVIDLTVNPFTTYGEYYSE